MTRAQALLRLRGRVRTPTAGEAQAVESESQDSERERIARGEGVGYFGGKSYYGGNRIGQEGALPDWLIQNTAGRIVPRKSQMGAAALKDLQGTLGTVFVRKPTNATVLRPRR